MSENIGLEKVYEFVENFDFQDLSEQQKSIVLDVITESEYIAIRATIIKTSFYFEHEKEPMLIKSSVISVGYRNGIVKFIKQPVPLYKIAAAIALFFGLYSGFKLVKGFDSKMFVSQSNNPVIFKTDTVLVTLIDTLEIIKERIVYVERKETPKTIAEPIAQSTFSIDCDKEICTKDIDRLKDLTCNNKISNDSLLKRFLNSMN